MDEIQKDIIESNFAISNELSLKLSRYSVKEFEFLEKMSEINDSNESNNIIKIILEEKSEYSQSMGYYEDAIKYYDLLATFIASELNNSPFEALKLQNKVLLKSIIRAGHTHVRIKTCGEGGCPECRKTSGRIYDVKEASKINPIPNPKCGFDLYQSGHNYCRCTYEAVSAKNIYKADKIIKKDINYKNYMYGFLFILLFISIIFACYELYILYLSFS